MVDVDVCVSSHLKEELALAVEEWLRVISTIKCDSKYSKSTKELKSKAILNFK